MVSVLSACVSITPQPDEVQTPPALSTPSIPSIDQQSMPAMDHDAMSGMDHSAMSDPSKSTKHDMSTMPGMSQGAMQMQGGAAPANARDPHAYADGFDFGPIPRPRFADEHNFGSLMVDRLEGVHTSDNNSATYDLQAWYGRDYDRAVFKAEGAYDNSEVEEASTELLWSHAVTAYWNSQLGIRYDSGEGPNRSWLAFGVQGLAPYWFEVDATAYIGEERRFALNLEAEYELLFTQKLILQPRIEADFYGKDDSELGIGAGLSELTAGIRLRYEIRREFAPYVGIERTAKFRDTAVYASDAGEDTKETQAVAGLRFWF